MLKQTIQNVYHSLVKTPGASVLSKAAQLEILRNAKVVRGVDYVTPWEIDANGVCTSGTVETRANWVFLLCGVAIYNQMNAGAVVTYPYFKFTFPELPDTGRIKNKTAAEYLDTAPAVLAFGCEGNDKSLGSFPNYHFEEYKNVLHILPERAIIHTQVLPYVQMNGLSWTEQRGHVIFTGLEISMTEGGANG